MKVRRIADGDTPEYMVVFDRGDEAVEGLTSFARDHDLNAARITGVGGFEEATLGFFDWESRSYREIPVVEQVEVLSFDGDLSAEAGDEPHVHVHVVLGRSDGKTVGGHLLRGRIRPTLEVIVDGSPTRLRRVHDAESGLSLIDPEA
jgi:uncharacterized protein